MKKKENKKTKINYYCYRVYCIHYIITAYFFDRSNLLATYFFSLLGMNVVCTKIFRLVRNDATTKGAKKNKKMVFQQKN